MRISVVVPVYNVAPYLGECLDSILNQTVNDPASVTFKSVDWEAVCVDDGSTDESGMILDAYAQRDSRVKVIHQKNGGEGAARNTGLKAAHGDWIMFLDSDDVYHPQALEIVGKLISQQPGAELVKFKTMCFRHGDKVAWPGYANIGHVVIDTTSSIRDSSILVHFAEKAYRKDVLIGLAFTGFTHGADIIFQYECMSRVTTVVATAAELYGYRNRAGSAMTSLKSARFFEDRIAVCCAILEFLDGCDKNMPRASYLREVEILTSGYVRLLLQQPREMRAALWELWFGALGRMLKLKKIPAYFYLALLICKKTNSRFVTELLFLPPLVGRKIFARLKGPIKKDVMCTK